MEKVWKACVLRLESPTYCCIELLDLYNCWIRSSVNIAQLRYFSVSNESSIAQISLHHQRVTCNRSVGLTNLERAKRTGPSLWNCGGLASTCHQSRALTNKVSIFVRQLSQKCATNNALCRRKP